MKAFAVYVNGRRLWTAGVGAAGVLTTIVTWSKGRSRRSRSTDLHMHVGGIEGATTEHFAWKTPALKVGDKVTVKIIETETVDAPTKRFVFDEKQKGRAKFRKTARGKTKKNLSSSRQ